MVFWMKDINTLTGIEFENLCQALLQKAGFDVETTKASGDGGIDLIARNNQPFFSGKYIIQCKRYTGSVGEPVVRDLYGVVMGERANKGILMTTGHFTVSAVRFASDKNLELIDGERMAKLLFDYEMTFDNDVTQLTNFTQFACFDKQKYDFYKSMVAQNICTIEMGNDFLFSFMFDYFVRDGSNANDELYDMIHCGFAEEYLRLFDWYINKYCKRAKGQLNMAEFYASRYKGIAQIYNLNLFEFVKDRYTLLKQDDRDPNYCIKYHWDNDYDRKGQKIYSTYQMEHWNEEHGQRKKRFILRNLKNTDKVKFVGTERFHEIMNLLSLFNYLNIQSGVNHINRLLFGSFPELEAWIVSQDIYCNALNGVTICYGNPYEANWSDFSFKVDLKPYFDRFRSLDRGKMDDEITKIEALLASI